MKDGIYYHVHGKTPFGDVAFDNYHLKQDVYKEAAREAGLRGESSWEVDECVGEVLERGVIGWRECKGVADLSHGAQLRLLASRLSRSNETS